MSNNLAHEALVAVSSFNGAIDPGATERGVKLFDDLELQ